MVLPDMLESTKLVPPGCSCNSPFFKPKLHPSNVKNTNVQKADVASTDKVNNPVNQESIGKYDSNFPKRDDITQYDVK